jgi:sugar lactone lactonase YvrE
VSAVHTGDRVDPGVGWTAVVAGGCELAERPVWDERSGSLVWVDCLAGDLHRAVPPAGGRAPLGPWVDAAIHLGALVGAAGLRSDGGLVVTVGAAFLMLDRAGRPDADQVRVDLPVGHRFNDGACGPAGRFLAGTTSMTSPGPDGVLWSLSPRGRVSTLLEGVTESNGLGWSPDGATFYYVDSGEPAVRRYRYDAETGALGSRLADLVVLVDGVGVPDGLVVDSDGAVWVALWGGGSIRQYAPDGSLLAACELPVDQPTCPVLAGADLDLLVVTTAWEGMDAGRRASQPLAGHVLARRVPSRGLASYRFGGGPR